MPLKIDFTLWLLTRFLWPPDLDEDPIKIEQLYFGRILTVRFLFSLIVSLSLIFYVWKVQGFKSHKITVRVIAGYVICLVILTIIVLDTEQLYHHYWYQEHLGKLVVWFKLSEIVLDVFTMSQCTFPKREDIRIIGGIAAASYSLDFVEILLIWFGVTID
ncbi:unnamed protein product [Mytilus coruscus]|uniref:Uncharacterized protein n=1 Tax=Mytilus coruscus TaxID=42192 RepID=A0A6J8DB60_MYTCO|nr:unnamed protein product [Mytilus coruscus]